LQDGRSRCDHARAASETLIRRMTPSADFIIENAAILTMVDDGHGGSRRAGALAVAGNRILGVGERAAMQSLKAKHTRVIDAGGATVLPGLIESHIHLFPGAVLLDRLDLSRFAEPAARIAAIGARVRSEPGDGLVMVEQARPQIFGAGTRIDRHFLDAISPQRPLALMGGDHHTVWANTAALKQAGLFGGRAMPPGNEVVMGEDGHASGELREFAAFEPVVALTPTAGRESLGLTTGRGPLTPPSRAERAADKALLKNGLAHLAKNGFTSFHNFDGDSYQLALLSEIEKERGLAVRARYPFRILPGMAMSDFALAEAWRRDHASPFLKQDFIKIFMDGVIETTTAAMLEDYCGHPGLKSVCLFEAADFDAYCIEAARRGFPVAVHAIGDAAVRRTLDGYEAALRATNRSDLRHRIEHIEALDRADLHRFAQLGVIASFQPTHAPGGSYPKEPTLSLLGAERMKLFCPWRTMRDTGARICFSSDWPVSPVEPFISVKAALTREPAVRGAPDESQRLMETLASMTRDNAFAAGEENDKGMLRPGMLADIVILDRDVERVAPEEIDETRVQLTMCDGGITFEA
jgi:predicted amidohydrolase YtcJ